MTAKNNADVLIFLFFLGFYFFLNNADVEKCGSFKSFGFIYIYIDYREKDEPNSFLSVKLL